MISLCFGVWPSFVLCHKGVANPPDLPPLYLIVALENFSFKMSTFRFQLVYKDATKISPGVDLRMLRYSTQDVSTDALGNLWVYNTNLTYMKPFSEVLPHSPDNVFFTQ